MRRAPDIVVTGHQWWWGIRYPDANAITANEIDVPTNRDMLIAVEAADVIHDFWVPRLGRKVDAVPGKRNFIWIRAQTPGEYQGACAAYCRSRFRRLSCVSCHNIAGVNQQKQYVPDLTHEASRHMLAAGRLQNTPANRRDWLREPNIIKPSCLMPNLNHSDADLTALTVSPLNALDGTVSLQRPHGAAHSVRLGSPRAALLGRSP